ncbi:MAG: hypothetical protein MJA31_14375, partial [Clostridia bacterium]|nr:hypothetical protein [Clostridia bacterium]
MNYEEARLTFLGKMNKEQRLNCAQVLTLIFKDHIEELNDTVEQLKKYGHGRAPDGECGIVYAGRQILIKNGLQEKVPEFVEHFVEI